MESPLRHDDLNADFRVIETLRWDGKRPVRGARHIERAAASCAVLGIPFEPDAALRLLDNTQKGPELRLRLSIDRQGAMALQSATIAPAAAEWRIALVPERLDPDDFWLRHKTTRRALYDAWRARLPSGVDEVIFANRRGEICEGTITNLFFDHGAGLRTPPVSCGLLPGILRGEMLDSGTCHEAILPLARMGAVRFWVGNSLRGLIPARLTEI